jgi:hypothetical protein
MNPARSKWWQKESAGTAVEVYSLRFAANKKALL